MPSRPRSRRPKKATPPAHLKMEGRAKMMRIYIGEADRWRDKPLYQALVEAMRANDIAGVTVYRGILGYGAHRRMHKDKALHLIPRLLHHAFGRRYRGEAPSLSAPCRSDGGRRSSRLLRCGHHQVLLPRSMTLISRSRSREALLYERRLDR